LTPQLAIAATLFCFAGALTPGPNNVMLLASGVNFGFARTLPHIVGVVAGYTFLLFVVAIGLGEAVLAHPLAWQALRAAGVLYLVWLAWKIATARGAAKGEARGAPFTFLQAAAFQWVNVKGVLVAVSAVAAFVRPADFAATLALLLAVATLATMASTTVWTLFGSGLRGLLNEPRRARVFNLAMALLLLASAYPMLAGA
jgi:threonine/homoserine/homoserine lactone efflux protein